jgi:hypothetical protein
MVLLNSIEQTRDTVTLYNSSFQNIEENYINIITRTDEVDFVLFDGLPLPNEESLFQLSGEMRTFLLLGYAYLQARIPSSLRAVG